MLAQLAVSGLFLGAIYALIALSMTALFRATTIVNFGHGDLVMGGAFIAFIGVTVFKLPYVLAALVSLVVMFIVGVAIQRFLMQPMARGPHLSLAMMTVAFGYFIHGVARYFWGRDIFPMPPVLSSRPLEILGVVVTSDELLLFGVVIVLMMLFFGVFYGTRTGKLMQAIFQTERGAALVGVNVLAFHRIMWGVAAAMAAVAGVLVAPVTLLHPDMGAGLLIRGFAAATLGGFGSFGGAVVGGLVLGVLEQVTGGYISTVLIDITAYLVIVAVLIVRPSGLFGAPITRRV